MRFYIFRGFMAKFRKLESLTVCTKRTFHQTSTKFNVATGLNKNTRPLNQILSEAERVLNNQNSSNDLQSLLSDEMRIVTEILKKMVGTNHSLSEVEKLYQSGSSSQNLVRGLVVLLMSKTASKSSDDEDIDQIISKHQLNLAKIVEMLHMAVLIHREIRNVGSNEQDESSFNLSTKISVLFGDFLWAKAWKEMASMGDIEVIDMMVSVLLNTSQGQFLSEVELAEKEGKFCLDYWLEKNFLLTACLPAFGCKSVLKLAKVDEDLQQSAYEFGQNFGFINKAFQEIQWFLRPESMNKKIDFFSLPVIMHYIETGESLIHLNEVNLSNKSKSSDITPQKDLLSIVRLGPGLSKSKLVLDGFRNSAFKSLNQFPDSEAKIHLKNIIDTMSF